MKTLNHDRTLQAICIDSTSLLTEGREYEIKPIVTNNKNKVTRSVNVSFEEANSVTVMSDLGSLMNVSKSRFQLGRKINQICVSV